jgi:hypothetical protein
MDHYGGAVLCPPYVPADNPTGCYVTDFTLDPGVGGEGALPLVRRGRGGVLRLGERDLRRLRSGQQAPVGVQDHRVREAGRNRLAVQVMRFCDGSYLEDQDYWHRVGHPPVGRALREAAAHISDYPRPDPDRSVYGECARSTVAGRRRRPRLLRARSARCRGSRRTASGSSSSTRPGRSSRPATLRCRSIRRCTRAGRAIAHECAATASVA